MKITFLGSGGGRFATISQKRMTGGFRVDDFGGRNYHIDPGPGALIRSYQFGLNPTTIDGIFVSHTHTDHYNDAEILIEAMTRGMTKNNGIIMGSESVYDGYKKWGPAISNYHKSKSQNIVLKPGEIKKTENFTIKGTKTIHGDPTGVGFQMKADGITLSYTSDTKYFKELHKYHEGADILIASVLRPGTKSIKGHMCTNNFANLINEIEPKLAIMTHFGFKMLNNDPIKEAKKVMKKTGVKTIAAFDGLKIDINKENIQKSKYVALKTCSENTYNKSQEIFPVDVEDKKPHKKI
ncbi:MAG: MBL fold metallo-hydrolase [Methanobacteriaceae archaeon]|nr:MBL fold metallo-hydrolase [Methanobacteriaceae archaeon]